MKYSEEEQKYMKELEAAFKEQRDVKFRTLTMTKDRYQQLAYTYCKIVDEEEMKDFAFISTHEQTRIYYLSNTNLALLEKIKNNGNKDKQNPLDNCVGNGKLSVLCDYKAPLMVRVVNSNDFNNPNLASTWKEITLGFVLLTKTILLGLSIALLIKLLSLPLDELAAAYLASHTL